MLVKKLGANALLPMLFQQVFLNSEIVLVVIVQLLYDVIHQVDYEIGQHTDKYKIILIVKGIMEQT